MLMILLSLLPGGLLQLHAVMENGYWYARELAFTGASLPRLLEWLRMPGDLIFMFAGVVPLVLALARGYISLWRDPAT
jgi:nitric oxide reductase subunit B